MSFIHFVYMQIAKITFLIKLQVVYTFFYREPAYRGKSSGIGELSPGVGDFVWSVDSKPTGAGGY